MLNITVINCLMVDNDLIWKKATLTLNDSQLIEWNALLCYVIFYIIFTSCTCFTLLFVLWPIHEAISLFYRYQGGFLSSQKQLNHSVYVVCLHWTLRFSSAIISSSLRKAQSTLTVYITNHSHLRNNIRFFFYVRGH